MAPRRRPLLTKNANKQSSCSCRLKSRDGTRPIISSVKFKGSLVQNVLHFLPGLSSVAKGFQLRPVNPKRSSPPTLRRAQHDESARQGSKFQPLPAVTKSTHLEEFSSKWRGCEEARKRRRSEVARKRRGIRRRGDVLFCSTEKSWVMAPAQKNSEYCSRCSRLYRYQARVPRVPCFGHTSPTSEGSMLGTPNPMVKQGHDVDAGLSFTTRWRVPEVVIEASLGRARSAKENAAWSCNVHHNLFVTRRWSMGTPLFSTDLYKNMLRGFYAHI